MTCCNMAIEMGAKAGICPPDAVAWDYIRHVRPIIPFELSSDSDARYIRTREYHVDDLAPQVAVPHNVDLGVDVTKVAGTPVDQIFIGSCTNGRYEDFRDVAEVLGTRKFSDNVRVIIIPASRQEYLKTLRAGLIERFVEAGALVEAPCCGPCMGGAFGLLAPGEISLSTSNRNFRGRQGSTSASVYLCSPATAAASADASQLRATQAQRDANDKRLAVELAASLAGAKSSLDIYNVCDAVIHAIFDRSHPSAGNKGPSG